MAAKKRTPFLVYFNIAMCYSTPHEYDRARGRSRGRASMVRTVRLFETQSRALGEAVSPVKL
jgi:hypothetical protein